MKIVIWGSRGSLPASLNYCNVWNKIHNALKTAAAEKLGPDDDIKEFIEQKLPFSVKGTYGGNTSCVELRDGDEVVLFDAGTGLRDFSNYFLKLNRIPAKFHIFLSHLHWDHIQGFPFFVPAFIWENSIEIYGYHDNIEKSIIKQQESPNFPVPLEVMQAKIGFNKLEYGKEYSVCGYKVTGFKQNHPGASFGYRFEKDGKSIVYATDTEFKGDPEDTHDMYVKFIKGADVLIFDSQYSLADSFHTKENWGHSSNITAVELAISAEVKKLVMFHSEPVLPDETLDKLLEDTIKYAELFKNPVKPEIYLAYDGMEIEI